MVLEQLSRPVGCGKLVVEDEMVNPEDELSKVYSVKAISYDQVIDKLMLVIKNFQPDRITLYKNGEPIGNIHILKEENKPPLSKN